MVDALPPHRQRRALARPEAPPDRDEWYAEAIRALPPDAPTQPPPSQEAIDSTGSIRVVVDAEGHVQDVEISTQWRAKLDADVLAATLLETYHAAVQLAVDAYASARLAALAAGSPRPVIHDSARAEPENNQPSPDPSVDREAWRRWIQELNAHIEDLREERTWLEAVSRQGPRAYAGPHGYLIAIVQGHEVTGISVDTDRVRHADTEHLEQDARAILTISSDLQQS